MEDEIDEMEAVYAAQYSEIKRTYGKKRADEANYGWGEAEDSVATKVYGSPAMVVLTYFDPETFEVLEHSHRPY